MNVELLRKIAAVIQEKPAEFQMLDWHMPIGGALCGTAHCIGGWAQVLCGVRFDPSADRIAGYWGGVGQHPRKLLDLDEPSSDRLFFADEWPEQFDASSPASSAARIEHFIETGGRE